MPPKKRDATIQEAQRKYAPCPLVSAAFDRYLDGVYFIVSRRLESFVIELVIWGHKQLKASKHTVFDQAFPFLEVKQDDFEPLGALEVRGGGRVGLVTRRSGRHERPPPAPFTNTTEHDDRRRSRLDRGNS